MTILTLLQAGVFGNVKTPPGLDMFPDATSGGIVALLNIVLKLLIVIASIYTVLQLIFAGFGFISAGGDPKNVEAAWSKIWQSLVGLAIIAGSFVLASIIGYIIFGDARAILSPSIYTIK